ncbi:unnamed protein product [Oncorhynchus mykiss]|uniref:Homeobox domain-containing protein n=1 Tax=Oncorhynchus mykiss TaxID=8022 RepID=A0A060X8Q0_ONCMY|nr:unnamed protein product [Oncorhynchus mykiss]
MHLPQLSFKQITVKHTTWKKSKYRKCTLVNHVHALSKSENCPSDSMSNAVSLPPLMEGYGRKRKKRTSIETNIKLTLEKRFLDNPKPNSEEIMLISEQLSMEKEVVRVWFCNRRQKQKRIYCPVSTSPMKSHNFNSRMASTSRSYSPPASGGKCNHMYLI